MENYLIISLHSCLMNLSYLERIGLTKGEARVYLALLELGSTTAGPLIRRVQMQKSTVYFCLDSLIDKGLVSYIIKNNVKNFEAGSPERLLDYLKKQEKNLHLQMDNVQSLMPKLYAKMNVAEKHSSAKLFEGWSGMKSAFDDILQSSGPKDEYLIYSVCPEPDVFPHFFRFINKFHQERVRKKIPVKIIVGEEYKATIGKARAKERRTEVRYFPSSFMTPAAINVYSDRMLIAIWAKTPSALLIESKAVSDSFRAYFKVLWNSAKR